MRRRRAGDEVAEERAAADRAAQEIAQEKAELERQAAARTLEARRVRARGDGRGHERDPGPLKRTQQKT